jgi:hypothetical protein
MEPIHDGAYVTVRLLFARAHVLVHKAHIGRPLGQMKEVRVRDGRPFTLFPADDFPRRA